ncbi:FliH/SctL family protein [Desulfosporosinus sp. BICA1-9]|uniref:FliH/SctL family protein n=1 Tax=Desulfosporosinus sp. BICA1-9 TaxID=1531958 RepID=UPI00054B97C2|nr:FliH/SctL family protein [Desulfosporosinus sp. BICA1-9]KJS47742.1 MAG: flagellar assembly protein FliH [Peptococcaceae bacterium BRH_c23]KJS90027.1 MAG: flagellar assembly protein FliH [Desulfosporosinus sp. BICA1-9]HBW36435.1 flagellar assembly protein FliH [Desulfosporosinus sp.]
MRLSINGRVVKSYDVEVSTPRMVENQEGFQQLGNILRVVSVSEEDQPSTNQEYLDWRETSYEEEAKAKAAIILAEAKASAEQIIVQAQAESERLRQEVLKSAQDELYPAAKAEGYKEGRLAGEAEGKLAGEAEGKRLTEQANQLFQLAQRAVQEEYSKVDELLLRLAIKIAERLVRASLAVEPQRLLAIIQALTLLPQERQGWRLHVSPHDVGWLEGHQIPCPWVIDESLKLGDCFLDCQEGVFDARLEAQLDKLEHTLREELEHGGVESFDPDGSTD